MVVFNYSGGEINAKIVYYGPGLSGKTTNLEYIYSKMPAKIKGKMISMKTRTDRTLFFDFLPLELGEINGFKVRFLLYTVPGQVYYNATRKLVLKGADAVVFVADSDAAKLGENIESLRNLEENLNEHDLSLDDIPWVIQYNKRDLESALPLDKLNEKLNVLKVPSFEAVATEGKGVYETFQTISKLLYQRVKKRIEDEDRREEQAEADEELKASAETAVTAGSVRKENAKDGSVSQVIEVALREVKEDRSKDAERTADEPVVMESPEPVADKAPKPKPDPSAKPAGHDIVPEVEIIRGSKGDHDERGETSSEDDFQFASLADVEVDEEMGRIVDLDIGEERRDYDEREFITDPCKGAPPPGDEDEGQTAARKVKRTLEQESPLSQSDEFEVKVPVIISPSQVRKNVPLRLILEIQVVDDSD